MREDKAREKRRKRGIGSGLITIPGKILVIDCPVSTAMGAQIGKRVSSLGEGLSKSFSLNIKEPWFRFLRGALSMRIRKDVWKLTDDTLVWYARAVATMQSRTITDPTSWRYQAAIHDYVSGADPLAVLGETLPSKTDMDTFWAQCQHGSWYFLPWHRGYLFYFEQIVRGIIQQLG